MTKYAWKISRSFAQAILDAYRPTATGAMVYYLGLTSSEIFKLTPRL